jgi:hypothetical protein
MHGHRCRQSEPASELRRRQAARQFQQPEGVSTRFRDDLFEYLLIERPRKGGCEEGSRIFAPQRPNLKLRQSNERLTDGACREQ